MNLHLPHITKRTVLKAAMLSLPVIGGIALAALSTAALPIVAGLGLAGLAAANTTLNLIRPPFKKPAKGEIPKLAEVFKGKSLLPPSA